MTECAYTLSDSLTPVHILTYAYDSRQQLTGITGLPALNASSGNCSVSGYDAAGNPLSYRGASLNWFRGRMLKNCTLPGGTALTYAYDSNGIRVSKTVNDTTHIYFTEGSRIRAEKRTYGQTSPEIPGSIPPSDILTYIYDASGITGMSVNSDQPVFFLKNQQGDVKFIVDANGNTLNEYVYDAWGNHRVYKYLNGAILTDSSGNPIDISNNSSYTNDIGNVNPFRYRSYYFDSETGWYYLQSRYYDPQTRRFINADDPSVPANDQATVFGGLNLYAYCLNNPVNMVDPSGHFAVSFGIAALIAITLSAATIGGGTQLVSNALAGKTGSDLWRGVVGATLGAAINALALCLSMPYGGVSLFIAASASAIVQTGVDVIETLVRGENIGWNTLLDLGINFSTALVGNYIGSKIIPTNAGWFKPQKFLSVFVKPYGQKILMQTAIGAGLSGIINFVRNYDYEKSRILVPHTTMLYF